MRRRYVKRYFRKLILFIATILILSFLTSLMVERRMRQEKEEKSEDLGTDFNGDPVTRPYSRLYKIAERLKPPVPPRRQRLFPRELIKPEDDIALTWYEGTEFQIPIPEGERKDWHDYEQMEADKKRVGFGEHGQPAFLTDENLKELERNMSMQNGFNALLSDFISVNRSLPDVRKEACHTKKYFIKLPSISVVIPCYNEHLSVLQRTLHSIRNRSPRELLEEIIVVDDWSDRENLHRQLEDYIEENFPKLVRIIRLPGRQGLISARLAGAREAKGDVLIFFDSHIECGYNWLPPLLEPIAINRKISTCPIVDVIDHTTFGYGGAHQEGSRGAFDWDLTYKQLPVLPEDAIDKTRPLRNPVMMGGLFAIGREFFWELGGYDEGLDIWGAEQFELSFKIWMCGGMILDVPCSRVAHIFRGPMEARPSPRKHNFLVKNNKRVAEVWMDEYKKYIYEGDLATFENLDPGDLSQQIAVRQKLKCKPFKWYLEVVAPDILEQYPPVPPPDFAHGTLRSIAFPQYCLDTMNGGANKAVGMFHCAANHTNPQRNQFWALSWRNAIHIKRRDVCLDVQDGHPNATVWMWLCHNLGGNQFWSYDRKNLWLVHGRMGSSCLEVIKDGENMKVVANKCDPENQQMKWVFGFLNNTALDAFHADYKTS